MLALRGILSYNLYLGHQGTHDPILPSLLNLMLRQGFALSLGPAVEFCYRAALQPREGQLQVSGHAWRNLLGKVVCGMVEPQGWTGGLEAAGQHPQGRIIHPLPGRGC